MSTNVPENPRRLPWLKLAVVAIVILAGVVMILRGVDLRGVVNQGMRLVREAGPWVFFGAMALLPAVGFPMSLFTIPAGEAFRDRMGLGGVIAVALAVLAVNLAFGYWVARYAFRPLLTRLLARYGYTIPRVTAANALQVALLVRLTPGPPYALQTGILGVAEVPFRLYMIVSWLAVTPWVLGAIILGQGLFAGNVAALFAGLGVIVVAVVAVQMVRRKLARRES